MRSNYALVALLLALTPIPVAAAISGIVMMADGQPVAGARVTLHALEAPEARRARLLSATPERVPMATAQTDSKGSFSLESPKQPVVDLRIDARGYDPEVRRIEREDEVGAIVLTKRAMSTGLVTAGGKPLAGATVVVNYGTVDYTVRTDDKGRYEAPEPKHAGAITAIHPDYAIDEERFLSQNAPASKLNRTLVAGTSLSGRAVAADGTTPVAKATISIDGWPLATSGEDGTFTLAHVPAKWSTLTARKDALLGQQVFPAGKTLTLRMERAATISGRILDAKTKVPVAGASVNMFIPRRMVAGEISPSAFTDAKGTYTMTVPAGSYMVMAAHPAFDMHNSDVTASLGQQTVKDFTLSRLGRISGVVVDEEKRPVAVASVSEDDEPLRGGMPSPIRMMRGGSNRAVSGPDGRFSLRVGGDQEIRLRAVKKGLPPAKGEPLRVAPGDRKTGVVLIIPTGIAVTGNVKDASGDPLPGVAVSATESTDGGMGGMMMSRIVMSGFIGEEEDLIRSGPDGSFTLHLKEGTYDFSFKREGYAPKSVRAQKVTVSGGLIVETTLEPAVEIAGRVTRGGMGVAGVMIATLGPDSTAMTGPDGSFTLGNLSPGTIRLMLRKEDELVQEQKTVTAPVRDVVFELPAGGTVRGRVVEKGTRKAITSFTAGVSTSRSGGGMVRMSPPLNRNFTSDDGSFTLEHVPTGTMNLIATAPGFAAARTTVEVQEGKVVSDIVLELEAGVKLVGRVTDSSGSPVSDASVMIRPSATGSFAMTGSLRRTTTDGSGEYTLDSLDAGEETVMVTHAKHSTVNKTVMLKGSETRLDIQLAGGVRVAGVVVTESGMPVADAEVRASSSEWRGSARTNASGAFELESLTPARYRFSASKSGFADASVDDVDVTTGTPVRIVMGSGGTIYGQVSGLAEKDYAYTTVQASSGRSTSSAAVDPSGNFRIEGAPTGTVQVMATVRTPSFDYRSSATQSVEVTPGSSQQVTLEFRGDTTLQGRVSRNGSPLPGASVYFMSTGGGRASAAVTADEQGIYRVNGLDAGEYRVSVSDIERGGSYTTTYTLRGSATFDIDYKTGQVRGRVIDASSNEPIADANVTLRATSGDARAVRGAMTDPSGSFVVELVPAGSYAVSASRDGYGNQMLDLTVSDAGREGLELKLSRNDGVILRVVDGRDGRAISAMVTVFDPQGRVVHDSRMSFGTADATEIRIPVAPGSFTATVLASGTYAPRTISFTSPSTQTVTLTPGGTILVQSKHSTRRRIRLLDTSGMVYPRFGQTVTTRDLMPGTLPLERIAPGTYTLQLIEADSNAILGTTQVVVREGETVTVSI